MKGDFKLFLNKFYKSLVNVVTGVCVIGLALFGWLFLDVLIKSIFCAYKPWHLYVVMVAIAVVSAIFKVRKQKRTK